MKVMAIDASTKSTGVAIFDNGDLIVQIKMHWIEYLKWYK